MGISVFPCSGLCPVRTELRRKAEVEGDKAIQEQSGRKTKAVRAHIRAGKHGAGATRNTEAGRPQKLLKDGEKARARDEGLQRDMRSSGRDSVAFRRTDVPCS